MKCLVAYVVTNLTNHFAQTTRYYDMLQNILCACQCRQLIISYNFNYICAVKFKFYKVIQFHFYKNSDHKQPCLSGGSAHAHSVS